MSFLWNPSGTPCWKTKPSIACIGLARQRRWPPLATLLPTPWKRYAGSLSNASWHPQSYYLPEHPPSATRKKKLSRASLCAIARPWQMDWGKRKWKLDQPTITDPHIQNVKAMLSNVPWCGSRILSQPQEIFHSLLRKAAPDIRYWIQDQMELRTHWSMVIILPKWSIVEKDPRSTLQDLFL